MLNKQDEWKKIEDLAELDSLKLNNNSPFLDRAVVDNDLVFDHWLFIVLNGLG